MTAIPPFEEKQNFVPELPYEAKVIEQALAAISSGFGEGASDTVLNGTRVKYGTIASHDFDRASAFLGLLKMLVSQIMRYRPNSIVWRNPEIFHYRISTDMAGKTIHVYSTRLILMYRNEVLWPKQDARSLALESAFPEL